MSWKTLGAFPPGELRDARLQLHHAAQVVASAGATWLPPEPDDSHPNFEWSDEYAALLGRPLPGGGARFALRVSDLSLVLVDTQGRAAETLSLDGRALEDAYSWMARMASSVALPEIESGIAYTAYEIPMHAIADGTPFAIGDGVAFDELARWFANGSAMLVELSSRVGASEVRVWPHHFDAGSLFAAETAPDGSVTRSVGLGFSPGDEHYEEPYLYVSPWPYPSPSMLLGLASGQWHTEGFVAAILRAEDLLDGAHERQAERASGFLDSAFEASRRLLERCSTRDSSTAVTSTVTSRGTR